MPKTICRNCGASGQHNFDVIDRDTIRCAICGETQ